MPIRYELDDIFRRVVVTVQGAFPCGRHPATMARQRAEHTWTYGILYDLRGMAGEPTVAELRQLMSEATELRQGEGPQGPVALLATADQALYARLCTYAVLGRSTTLNRGLSRPGRGRAVADRSGEGEGEGRDVMARKHPQVKRVVKIGAGLALLASGAVMLLLPGPGLATIAIGGRDEGVLHVSQVLIS